MLKNHVSLDNETWRVKAHGIQVVRLFYLSRKELLFLKELRDRFVGGLLVERKGPGEAKTPIHSKISLFKSPTRDVLSPGRVNPPSFYESSSIWSTRDSILWGWRRATEYFGNLFEVDRTKEVCELMAT